jgi:hypothetical protein
MKIGSIVNWVCYSLMDRGFDDEEIIIKDENLGLGIVKLTISVFEFRQDTIFIGFKETASTFRIRIDKINDELFEEFPKALEKYRKLGGCY